MKSKDKALDGAIARLKRGETKSHLTTPALDRAMALLRQDPTLRAELVAERRDLGKRSVKGWDATLQLASKMADIDQLLGLMGPVLPSCDPKTTLREAVSKLIAANPDGMTEAVVRAGVSKMLGREVTMAATRSALSRLCEIGELHERSGFYE